MFQGCAWVGVEDVRLREKEGEPRDRLDLLWGYDFIRLCKKGEKRILYASFDTILRKK